MASQLRFGKFVVFNPFLRLISEDTINTCLLDFFRGQLWWENTYSRVSLILSLNNLGFVIFVLFTSELELFGFWKPSLGGNTIGHLCSWKRRRT